MNEFKEIKKHLRDVNVGLDRATSDGEQPTVHFDGRPDFRVIEFKPFSYEEYGRFFGRGPKLCGEFAVSALVWSSDRVDDTKFISEICIVINAGEALYGASVGRNCRVINHIADEVIPENDIVLSAEKIMPTYI